MDILYYAVRQRIADVASPPPADRASTRACAASQRCDDGAYRAISVDAPVICRADATFAAIAAALQRGLYARRVAVSRRTREIGNPVPLRAFPARVGLIRLTPRADRTGLLLGSPVRSG